MKIACVILAGGEGRRMGGRKPQQMLGGRTLLEHALTKAQAWADDLAIAVRSSGQANGINVRCIYDEASVEGPLGALIASLRFASEVGADALLTIPVDMPLLPQDLANRLSRELRGASAAIASSGGQLHPVCGLWRPSVLESLPAYLATGCRSLRGFAGSVGAAAVDWPIGKADPFFNINSPEDLQKAERRR